MGTLEWEALADESGAAAVGEVRSGWFSAGGRSQRGFFGQRKSSSRGGGRGIVGVLGDILRCRKSG